MLLHCLLPLLTRRLTHILKYIRIFGYRIGQDLIVLSGGVIYIPVHFSIVIPNVRVNAISEVGVGSCLCPQQIRKAKAQGIYLSNILLACVS